MGHPVLCERKYDASPISDGNDAASTNSFVFKKKKKACTSCGDSIRLTSRARCSSKFPVQHLYKLVTYIRISLLYFDTGERFTFSRLWIQTRVWWWNFLRNFFPISFQRQQKQFTDISLAVEWNIEFSKYFWLWLFFIKKKRINEPIFTKLYIYFVKEDMLKYFAISDNPYSHSLK